MKQDQKIWYEPHPVTPERKAELRAAGYTILDAVFKPAGESVSNQESNADASFEADNAAVGESFGTEGKVTPSVADWSAKQLKDALDVAGVEFHANTGKAKLAALYVAFERSGLDGADWNNLADEDKTERIEAAKAD